MVVGSKEQVQLHRRPYLHSMLGQLHARNGDKIISQFLFSLISKLNSITGNTKHAWSTGHMTVSSYQTIATMAAAAHSFGVLIINEHVPTQNHHSVFGGHSRVVDGLTPYLYYHAFKRKGKESGGTVTVTRKRRLRKQYPRNCHCWKALQYHRRDWVIKWNHLMSWTHSWIFLVHFRPLNFHERSSEGEISGSRQKDWKFLESGQLTYQPEVSAVLIATKLRGPSQALFTQWQTCLKWWEKRWLSVCNNCLK